METFIDLPFCFCWLNIVLVNGKFCKNPKLVTAEDFLFRGLDVTGESIGRQAGVNFTRVNVNNLPGLNTLGISLARLDFAPSSLIEPHIFRQATEIFIVLEGTLYVGFVTPYPNYKLFTKVLHKGDVFVFPIGLIRFQYNFGRRPAIAIAGFSSESIRYISIAQTVFDSNPPISIDVLTKTFQVNKNVINALQQPFKT